MLNNANPYTIRNVSRTGVTTKPTNTKTPEEQEIEDNKYQMSSMLQKIRYLLSSDVWDAIDIVCPPDYKSDRNVTVGASLSGNTVTFNLFTNCFKNMPNGYVIKFVFDTPDIANMNLKDQCSRENKDVEIYYGLDKPNKKITCKVKDMYDELRTAI